ncbi:MAG: hypothetical protein J0L93_04695 [Deltaproteobacteria bacterium]|nr:hypothetical protein [Deltaproteobacteria bacterium]
MSLQNLYAQTYLINPHDEKASSLVGLPLSKKDEDLWLSGFYRRVPLFSSLDRTKIKDENDETIESKIKRASQLYLELRYADAQSSLNEARQLISQSMPYPKTFEDLVEIAALQRMIGDAEEGLNEVSPEVRGFFGEPAFAARLSTKLQSELKQNQNIKYKIQLPSPTTSHFAQRILINGREKALPLELTEGKFLIHLLDGDELQAYWLTVSKNETHFDKIWNRSIWKNIEHRKLQENLIATRPTDLSRAAGIAVMIRDESNQAVPLIISQAQMGSILKEPSDPSTAWAKDFSKDSQINEDRSESSIFESPWFWTGVAVLAGVGGYFIYDATKTKSVSTP